jgi:large-conductance mechanosensitive channel
MEQWLSYLTTPDFIVGVVIGGFFINLIGGLVSNRANMTFRNFRQRNSQAKKIYIDYLENHPEKLQSERLKAVEYEIKATIFRVCIFISLGFDFLSEKKNIFILFALTFLLIDIINSLEAQNIKKIIKLVEEKIENKKKLL